MPAKGMKVNAEELADHAAVALTRLRERNPLVLCLTNTVVTNWTANCLLALGARPAMMEEPREAAELAAKADSLLVNLGTVTARQADAMFAAVDAANGRGVPWVLDPVAVDKLTYRRDLAFRLIDGKPTMIRGNALEIEFLKESVPAKTGLFTWLATGAVDEIARACPHETCPHEAAGSVPLRIANGVEMLTRVTGTGCAQGAIAAAFCAVESDPAVAAVAASLTMSLAGEIASGRAVGPGSFQVALLDALGALTPQDFRERARFV